MRGSGKVSAAVAVALALGLAALPSAARAQSCAEGECSRLVASIPFGTGQFQNGHTDLAIALMIAEGTLLSASIAFFALHQGLRGERVPAGETDDAIQEEAMYRWGNWITAALFAGTAAVGIVDAHLRFGGTEARFVAAPGFALAQVEF